MLRQVYRCLTFQYFDMVIKCNNMRILFLAPRHGPGGRKPPWGSKTLPTSLLKDYITMDIFDIYPAAIETIVHYNSDYFSSLSFFCQSVPPVIFGYSSNTGGNRLSFQIPKFIIPNYNHNYTYNHIII